MGTDKAFLKLDGKPLFERVLEAFREVFSRIILVGDNAQRFACYGLPIYPDIFTGSSLGGLYTGLVNAHTGSIFVAPCDLPFPSAPVIRHLLTLGQGHDAVVPRNGDQFEPLFAVYAASCIEPMRHFLEQGNLCIYDIFPLLNVHYVPVHELEQLPGGKNTFMNVNTPDEFARAERKERS